MENIRVALNEGRVVSVRGSVVDVHFAAGVPPLWHRLVSGEAGRYVLEVAALSCI